MGSPPAFDAQVAAIVRQVVLEYCPGSTASGAWCVAGARGAVLVRFRYAGEVHVVTTHRVRFDLSGPSPRLVIADVPTIEQPRCRTWSPALGAYVETVPNVEPAEVSFAGLAPV